jgi:hypothetical protein
VWAKSKTNSSFLFLSSSFGSIILYLFLERAEGCVSGKASRLYSDENYYDSDLFLSIETAFLGFYSYLTVLGL